MEKGDKDLEVIIETLTKRVKELEDINEGHRQLNGRLRVELNMWKQVGSKLEEAKNLLQGYKAVINKLSNKLRQKDS